MAVSKGNLMSGANILFAGSHAHRRDGCRMSLGRPFMTAPSRFLTALAATLLLAGVAAAQSQDPSGQSTGQDQSPSINTPAPQQPAPPPPDKSAKKQPGQDEPITSPDKVDPRNSK